MILLQGVRDPAADLLHLRRVMQRNVVGAPDDDRLELLAAHHGAQAGTAGDVLEVIHDARDANAVLTRGPDLADPRQPLADLGLERLLGIHDLEAPEVRRIADLDLIVLDPEIHRRGGGAGHDDRVPAGALELGAPEAPDLGFAEAAGQGRLRADGVARCPGQRRAGEDAHREHEEVVRAERIDARRQLGEEVVRDEGPATGMELERRLVHVLDRRRARGQIDPQDLPPAPVTLAHRGLIIVDTP